MINVLQSSVYAVLIAMGLVFVIPQNEIDLSVGGNYVLTGIVAALFMRGGMTPALAIVLALSVSVLIGPLNALTRVRTHNQYMTVAARAHAERNRIGHLS